MKLLKAKEKLSYTNGDSDDIVLPEGSYAQRIAIGKEDTISFIVGDDGTVLVSASNGRLVASSSDDESGLVLSVISG